MRNLFTLVLASFVLAVVAPYAGADDEPIIYEDESSATIETSAPVEQHIYTVSDDCTCEAESVNYKTETRDDEGTLPSEWGEVPW
jgi:hypothetical protein